MSASLIILTAEPKNWAPKQLEVKAKEAGFKVEVINPDKCYISLAGDDYISHDGTKFDGADICIPRLSEDNLEYKVAILNHLEKMGVKVINTGKAMRYASNKVESQILLNNAGIKTPATAMFTSEAQLENAVKAIGSKFPVIIKTIYGTHGIGVIRADSNASLVSIAQQLLKMNTQFILQEFIDHEESGRILLLDGKPLACVMRTIPKGDFRSNAHQGAELKVHEPSEKELETCKKAAKTLGITLAAVDYIVIDDEIILLEVNGSPGFEAMQKVVTDLDIGAAIINYCVELTEDANKLNTDNPPSPEEIEKGENDGVEAGHQDEEEEEEEKPSTDNAEKADNEEEEEEEDEHVQDVPTHNPAEDQIIGTVTSIIIKHFNDEKAIEARVDTGANLSSINGENIKIDGSTVRFKFNDATYKFNLLRTTKIKQANNDELDERPVIRVDLVINGQTLRNTEITINERGHMKYDMLLGRQTLAQAGVLVNPAVTNIDSHSHDTKSKD